MGSMSELAAETGDSGMGDYLAHMAEAKQKQEAYLNFLKEIPSVYERSLEQMKQTFDLDYEMRMANRAVRIDERKMHWNRK